MWAVIFCTNISDIYWKYITLMPHKITFYLICYIGGEWFCSSSRFHFWLCISMKSIEGVDWIAMHGFYDDLKIRVFVSFNISYISMISSKWNFIILRLSLKAFYYLGYGFFEIIILFRDKWSSSKDFYQIVWTRY